MTPSRIAAFAALVGAAAWLVRTVLIWGEAAADNTLADAALWSGYAMFAIALALSGYALVATAPIWLRVLVSAALPALVATVWAALVEAFASDWLTVLLGTVVGLVWAVLALRRTRPEPATTKNRKTPPTPGRRVATTPGRRAAEPKGRRASR